eukprot:CAMPEP_0172432110 /NCGR_PEP_ID=MMETSP1064-20121228/61519_1 /TAXON_ID=202472 /ORGANISM="Aulacoseira subarctica , Strain CCAP 1002/5" /LENGTH=475 /DNA_ID=CAMNT_0013179187 /DNA_START=162 /DNA_END=1589 /DNA_ORIENTATION=+
MDQEKQQQRELIRDVYGVQNSTIRESSSSGRIMASSGRRVRSSNHNNNTNNTNNNVPNNRTTLQQQQHSDSSSFLKHSSRPTIAAAHLVQQRQQGRVSTGGGRQQHEQDTAIAARVPVMSIYVARHIDVVAVLSKVFAKMNVLQHRFGRTSVTVQFPPREATDAPTANTKNYQSMTTPTNLKSKDRPHPEEDINNNAPITEPPPLTTSVEDTLLPRYIVVFRFGSCVFFNFTNREARVILEEIKKRADCCMDALPNGFEQREQFDIAISPGRAESIVTGDVATIQMLDLNNVAVISTVMGQTVALDSYNIYADELLATFATINANVKRTGNFTSMERNALFKVIAQNNSLFIDMVSKLGLKDRSDTVAWNFTQYDTVYQGMREEFLIDNRFDDIEFKLNLIQQNTKFFLEVMHQNKTSLLEWIIIGLITLECGLMCLEMSGMGHLMFESLGISTIDTTESLKQSSSSSMDPSKNI